MEQVIAILNRIHPGVDYTKEKNLFADHILASMDIVMIVSELNDAFDIEIRLPDLKPENFMSAETIYEMVQRLEDE